MALEREQFIKNMTRDFRSPGRLWTAEKRTLFLIPALVLLNVGLVLLHQSLRPGLGSQLHWALLLELSAATVLASSLCYWILKAVVPGRRVSGRHKGVLILSLVLFLGAFLSSFFSAPDFPSKAGARTMCEFEVLLYGGFSLGILWIAMARGLITHPRSLLAVAGVTGALIPAAVMQIACLYDPTHALLFHYGPVLVLAALTYGSVSVWSLVKRNA